MSPGVNSHITRMDLDHSGFDIQVSLVSMGVDKTSTGGLLFDMDGTLLDSTPAVLVTWEFFAQKYSLDLDEVLKTSHGVRTADNMRNWCGLTEDSDIIAATERFESMIVAEAKRLQAEGKTGLQILPGVAAMLSILQASPTPLWAVVTSATDVYASAALPTAGIPTPPRLVTAGDVIKGKPHPEPYLAGAKQLAKDIKDCIVVEDAPSGILSGVASGARVLAVCTSHTREQLQGKGATWIVQDLSRVQVTVAGDRVHLVIDESA